MKLDYKEKLERRSIYSARFLTHKWKLSLGISGLAFLYFLRSNAFISPLTVPTTDNWNEEEQIIDISLPEMVQSPSPFTVPSQPPSPTHRFTVRSGASLGHYIHQAGLEPKVLQDILAVPHAAHFKRIYPGQALRIQKDLQGKFHTLEFELDPLNTLVVFKADERLNSKIEEKIVEKKLVFGSERITDSFFLAGKQAKLDDSVIMELANVFAYDIDFAQDIKQNDRFKVLFEEHYVNGVKIGNGPIIAAEFLSNGKRYQAVRYTDPQGQTNYYTPCGQSLKKAFIRTPVQFARISSHFNLHRRHPILHQIRAHKGVDYAAPAGTPVKAAGHGKVLFIGKKGGYGNTIILQHGLRYSTLYAHLSSFGRQIKPGSKVNQGQIIGYVGSTGLASGPHLHYEFRIDGVHHDPLTVPLPQADGIAHSMSKQFLAHASGLIKLLADNEHTLLASNS